jgi:RHS repeat-associated protein
MQRSPSLRRFALPAALLVLSGYLAATQILEIYSASLTSYKAAKSIVQDVRPRAEQRGVNLDGSLRSGSTFSMAVAGNPFENAWRGDANHNGILLDTGTWSPTQVDLSLPAEGFRWNVGRSYNVRQDDSGRYDSDSYQGRNWFQTSQIEIQLYDDEDNTKDLIYLVWGADRYAEFQRTGSSSLVYKAKNGAAGAFLYTSGSPDTWAYTDQHGTVFTFFGFNTASSQANGQLWTIVDTALNKAYVGDPTTASTAVTNGFYSDGRISKAYDTADRRYTYSYTAVDSIDRLTEVKAETKSGGTWASPTGVVEVGKVEYGYYATADSNGDSGDLRTVKVTLPLSDSGINEVRVQYYRYWEGAYNASTNPGYPNHVKLFLDWEGARNYDYADATFDNDFLTETTANLQPYAAAYFEYDTTHRVNKAWFSGQCGCGGAGAGTHEYRYETNGSYSDGAGYDTVASSDFSGLSTIALWARRTSVDRPDGTWLTQYFDETGQALSRLQTDADPANTEPAPSKWVDRVLRDTDGMVAVVCTPASCNAYTHSSGAVTTHTGSGLIWRYTRTSSGNAKSFVTDRKYMKGRSGTEYLDGSYTWDVTTALKEIGTSTGVYVRRPLKTGERVYSQVITSGTTGSYETTYAYTTYSGASPPQPLAIEQITRTNPTVVTGNNGSGGSTGDATHLRKDGLPDFKAKTLGSERIIEYTEYTKGQVTKNTLDADTTSLSYPSGTFQHAGTPLDESTTHAYDEQGRQSTTTDVGGRVSKVYHSTLKDRRLVTLGYPKYVSGSGTFYGPVNYSVSNHAGKAEVQGIIGVSGGTTTAAQTTHIDETDDDPITAVDTGSSFGIVARLKTSHYDESGTRLDEQRAYFLIPSAEPGTDGTHYDPTKYGFDDIGRQWRVKEAHGTITRTVRDALGRITTQWIGTNDNGWSGGESSGADNMVKVEESEYDSGADDGNSLVTKAIAYVEDSATDKRETTYSHDVRGNILLVTSPQSPHLFYKVDNMDRQIAIGGFSSTANIVVGTDDPTTETSNRVTLSQTFYDERGQVWKEQRHKIDVADGSDDDNLQTLTWYDAIYRKIKRDGQQLEKWSFDRRDRQTHRFWLAVDNDSAYADADDVIGDIVLLEDQTTSDVDGLVIMQTRIDRLHDDHGTGETTGKLDTNADSDTLKYTATNLEGRIQITASWYDGLDRIQDRVVYGTNGGSDFDRDGLSVPSRSDTALRTTYTYNDDGTLKEVEDPKGIKQRTEYDALGRRTKAIANYIDGTPGGGANADQDRVISYAYADGLQVSMTADLPSGQTDQMTTYTFGTVKGTSAGDSKIATGHLLKNVTYPDSASGTDVVAFAYNAQSQQIWKKDQAGNIIETTFDTGGRETHKRVTTLDSDIDGGVRRISRTYNSRNLPELVTQYDNANIGSGSVVDEIKHSYESWGLLSTFEQDRNSAVGVGGSVDDYEVSYTYAKATSGRNTIRRTFQTLPSGNALEFQYRNSGGLHDEEASRVTLLVDGATALVNYNYSGLNLTIGTYYYEPDITSRQFGSTSGSYPDLDRFNRVVTNKWTKDLGTDVDFYNVTLAYDRDSNITSAEDSVHSGFDVIYTNDSLNRLIRAEEGTLSGGSISSRTRDQQWTLTQPGNWDFDKVDLNGDGDFVDAAELNDDRTHNDVNELSARDTDDNGTDNFTLAYDEAGNLTDDGEYYTYVWDAFYRLRKIKARATGALVTEYKYNGLGYRISIHEDTDDDGDVDGGDLWFHHAFYPDSCLAATYRTGDTNPKAEFVYHAAGLGGEPNIWSFDKLVLRDRDVDSGWTNQSDAALEERVYYAQNERRDVVALISVDGHMLEQVRYSAYGNPYGLPVGDTDSDGDCDAADTNQVQAWSSTSSYDVRGDVDLNGDVDSADEASVANSFEGLDLGRGVLSRDDVRNSRGFKAGTHNSLAAEWVLFRAREMDALLGRWEKRDPIVYSDSANLYQAFVSNPISMSDPSGMAAAKYTLCSDSPVANLPTAKVPLHYFGMPISSQWKHGMYRVFSNPASPDWFFANPGGTNPLGGGQGQKCIWLNHTDVLATIQMHTPSVPSSAQGPCLGGSGEFNSIQDIPPNSQCTTGCDFLSNQMYRYWHGKSHDNCTGGPGTALLGPVWTGSGCDQSVFGQCGAAIAFGFSELHANINMGVDCGGGAEKVVTWTMTAVPTLGSGGHVPQGQTVTSQWSYRCGP